MSKKFKGGRKEAGDSSPAKTSLDGVFLPRDDKKITEKNRYFNLAKDFLISSTFLPFLPRIFLSKRFYEGSPSI